jgi:phytoene dehydrogenase-like protein
VDTNFYDVVVCGGATGGLVAGALLARRGFRVLLLGHEAALAAFEAGSDVLSRAPAALPPLEGTGGVPVARVVKELDCGATIKRRTRTTTPAFRIMLPGQKLDVTASSTTFERELETTFASASPTVAKVLARLTGLARTLDPLFASAITLPPNGFWERREVGRLQSMLPDANSDPFAPLPSEHPLRAMFAAPALHAAALVAHDMGPVGETRAFDAAQRGELVFDGGLVGLQEVLLGRLETFGADRRDRLTPVQVVVRRGRVAGVRVRPRDETIGCHHLLWASSAASLVAALAQPPRSLTPAPRVAGYRYAIALLVDAPGIPEGTPARILAIGDPSRALTEDNAVAITVGRPGDGDRRVPVWVECNVSANLVDAGPSYLRALRGRVVHTLGRLIPGIARHVSVLASPYDGLPAERRDLPVAPPAAAHALPPPLVTLPAPRPLDVIGLRHATGVKNLYLVGRENLPGLGLEGDFISGWGAARLLSGRQPRRVAPGRRVLLGS